MLRVTADSNIYISALNFGGTPDKVLDLARAGEIALAVSEPILAEVARVLRIKFEWEEESIRLALGLIGEFAELTRPDRTLDVITEDPADNRVLECAVCSRSEFLVTGDKHLLKVERFDEVVITRAADFLLAYARRG